jgi:hypothetical protein
METIRLIAASLKEAPVEDRKNVLGRFSENDLRHFAASFIGSRKNDKPFLQTLILDILYNPRYRCTAPNGTPIPQQQQVPAPPQPSPRGTAAPQQQRLAPFWSDSLRKYIGVQEQQHPLMHPDVHGRYPELPPHLNPEQRQKMSKYRLAIAQHRVHQQQQHTPNTHTPGMQQMPLQHHQPTLPQLNTPAIVPEASAKPTGETTPTSQHIGNLTYRERAARIQKTKMEREVKQAPVDHRTASGPQSFSIRKPGKVFSYPAKRLSLFSAPEDWNMYDEDRSVEHDKQPERTERANKAGEWIQALGDQQTESEARSHAPVTLPRIPPFQRVNREHSLTLDFAPAASNETITARPRRLSFLSSCTFGKPKERKSQCNEVGEKEDVRPPVSPPLSPVPDQHGGTTKRKLSIGDLDELTLSPHSKRQRKEGNDVAEEGDDRVPVVKTRSQTKTGRMALLL